MTGVLPRSVSARAARRTDVLMADGVIAEIGPRLDAGRRRGDRGRRAVLLPGLVDLHTHLREPGREDTETIATGSAAAALGGFTAVHAMANTNPVADTAEMVEQVPGWASRPAWWTSVRSARYPRDWPASSWPSSATWPGRPLRSGCSPTTGTASPTPG